MSVLNGAIPSDERTTAFSVIQTQFPNEHNKKINTKQFLEASKGVVGLIERFGKVFTPIRYDMNGNITKITRKYNEDIKKYETLEDMILIEKHEGSVLTMDALLWLRRGLHFIVCFFQNILDDTDSHQHQVQDLAPCLKKAYVETLQRHHGWMGTQLFSVLSRFVPPRNEFIYILALERHHNDEYVLRDMRQFTNQMSLCVYKLINFYAENNLE